MELSFEDRIAHAMTHLEAARATLIAEIKHYPTPVAGCDVQYNHLLEEKSRVNPGFVVSLHGWICFSRDLSQRLAFQPHR